MTLDFWRDRRVLVTGHTGFKGAWLTLWLQRLGAQVTGVALPADDPASTFVAAGPWDGLDDHRVDIRDRARITEIVARSDPEVILHLAAQALVRRGYADPVGTYEANVLGTANVLDAARSAPSLRAIVVVTSDKVYANANEGRAFTEDDRLGGRDPYSSSKACCELLVASWRRSFLDGALCSVASARAGNVIGGGDRGEDRLLPDLWRALEQDRPLGLRYPAATRPWQFVLEPLYGYLLLAERLVTDPQGAPAAVNFGPSEEDDASVAEVVERAIKLWGSGSWTQIPGPHPPEAALLDLDASLAHRTLGWRPRLELDLALEWTVAWWQAWAESDDVRVLAGSQIAAYEELVAS